MYDPAYTTHANSLPRMLHVCFSGFVCPDASVVNVNVPSPLSKKKVTRDIITFTLGCSMRSASSSSASLQTFFILIHKTEKLNFPSPLRENIIDISDPKCFFQPSMALQCIEPC